MEEKKLTDDTEIDVGMILKALENKKEIMLEEVNRTKNSIDDLIVCVDGDVIVGAIDLIHRLQGENAEQRAKIERLTEENGYLKQCADTFLDDCKREKKQAVKDTAKEIYGLAVMYYDGSEAFDYFLQKIAEQYGEGVKE